MSEREENTPYWRARSNRRCVTAFQPKPLNRGDWEHVQVLDADELAARDKALREQIEQQMIERAYFHIAWEKGLTIIPAGHGRAKVPPHWVEAATDRLTPYLDIIRGEGQTDE